MHSVDMHYPMITGDSGRSLMQSASHQAHFPNGVRQGFHYPLLALLTEQRYFFPDQRFCNCILTLRQVVFFVKQDVHKQKTRL